MNILILNWRDPKNPKSGGAEIVTMEHAKAWVAAGHSVIWFTSRFANAKKEEMIDGVRFVRKGHAHTVHLLASFFYFFSGTKFDLVIDEIHGIPFFTPLYVRKPKIAFIHEVAGEIWDYMYSFPINLAGKLLEKWYFRLYKNILFWTDAESTRSELATYGIRKENSIAIPCPTSNKPLKQLPQKETNPTYLFVSRLVKMKGVEQVIRAFALLYEQDSKARLWIVGGGDKKYLAHLSELAKRLHIDHAVTFFGKVSEEKKLSLMKKAHILLHASVKEGWGLVVVEAASQGTPSVVYNVAGLRDVVQNGKTGIVVKKNSPDELAKEAQNLYKSKDQYKKFQERCLTMARELSWHEVTKQSLQYLLKAVK